jgi:LPS sulfotransferase NodH
LAATETGVFHLRDGISQGPAHSTPTKDPEPSLVPDQASTFIKLRKWIAHIINFECATELQFLVRGIEPTRLYYEDMLENVESVIKRILSLMETGVAMTPAASTFSRTASLETLNIKNMFVEHHREFLFKATSIRPALFY